MTRPDPGGEGGGGPKGGGASGPLRYAGFGVQLAASILLFMLLGQWVDRKLGTAGLFTILGAFLGFGAAIYWLVRQLKRDAEQGPK